MSTVLPFDRTSRRHKDAAREHRDRVAGQDRESRDLARTLGVTPAALDANGGQLYYHGPAITTIEAAYRRSRAAGRAALLAALDDYYGQGYETGTEDAAPRVRTDGRR